MVLEDYVRRQGDGTKPVRGDIRSPRDSYGYN